MPNYTLEVFHDYHPPFAMNAQQIHRVVGTQGQYQDTLNVFLLPNGAIRIHMGTSDPSKMNCLPNELLNRDGIGLQRQVESSEYEPTCVGHCRLFNRGEQTACDYLDVINQSIFNARIDSTTMEQLYAVTGMARVNPIPQIERMQIDDDTHEVYGAGL